MVVEPNLVTPDAKAFLELALAMYRTGKGFKDFQLLERSAISVVGVLGEKVLYSYNIVSSGTPTLLPAVSRGAFFAAGEFIWSVNVSVEINNGEADQSVFDHVLQTFKILE